MAKKITSSAPRKSAAAKATLPAKRGRKGVRCRNLSNEQRASLLQSLLRFRTTGSGKGNKKNTNNNTTDKTHDEKNDADSSNSNINSNGHKSTKLRKGALLEASKAFGVSTKTCKRIWERFLETCNDNGSGGDVSHRKHQSGRPKKISSQELHQKIQELPPETRSTVRGLARALGMPHTTIHRRLKSGEIQLEPLASSSSTRIKEENAKDATEDKTTNAVEQTNNANGRTKTDKSAKKSKGKGKVKTNSNGVKKESKQSEENGSSVSVVNL